MKKGYQTKTLDQISTILDNRRVPITKGVRASGEYPYYGASGIVDYVVDYIFDEDTLLISEDGANLLARSTPVAFPASGKYWVNNHAHILKFENRTTQRFVELYLESIPLDDYITGAAQPKLNQKALNSIPCLDAWTAEALEHLGVPDAQQHRTAGKQSKRHGDIAQVVAEVSVGEAKIEGTFKGNLTASTRIELASTAHVMGDVRSTKLVIAEGATFVGNCHVSPDALKQASEFVTPVAATPIKR